MLVHRAMKAVLILIFVAIALVAAAFVIWPILRGKGQKLGARIVLAAAATALVLGVGGGTYLMLGSPVLALRTLTGPSDTDLASLIAQLVNRVRANPQDVEAWTLLGRGYLTLGDPNDAAAALQKALALEPHSQDADLLATYGEALTMANGGAVPPEAETAFQTVLVLDPKNYAARYYVGLALAGRHQTAQALAMWQSLLADAPADAPWKGQLIDRIAMLRSGGMGASGAPNVDAMVAKLAAHLKSQPNDPDGWQRLIRSYSVLGETDKAAAALADAHSALKGNSSALAAIDAEAASLGLKPGTQASAAPADSEAAADQAAAQMAAAGGPAPDVNAMVARLAARLKSQPNDPAGWGRLIRSYSVLGQTDKAQAALADARSALKGDSSALAAIDAEAASLNLGK